jgi:hypothetical protein
MEKDLLISLSKSYSELIPQNEESLLLVIWLYQKVEKGFIDEDFEQKDLEDTIEDIAELLQKESAFKKESILKKLSSHFFITEPIGNNYQIHLTVFAKELCKLLIHQVQPEVKKLELFHVFKRTLPLQDNDLSSIENLKYWFDNNFLPARKEIIGHTELLQTEIEKRINELRLLLKPNIDNPKELISSFTEIFDGLDKQTLGLINTLDYKNDTLNLIKASKESFSQSEEMFNEFDKIQREVDVFFQQIHRRICSINDRIQLASKRLRSLFNTLRHKQIFKVKIEKLLFVLLKNSYNEKGIIKIHDDFPRRFIPSIKTKFISIPKIDFHIRSKALPEKLEIDKTYEDEERRKGLELLQIQEATAMWLERIDSEINLGKEIDFDVWFDRIVEDEKNLEVPIQVCFGLIEKHNRGDYVSIRIDKDFTSKIDNELMLWKMRIQTLPS